jgi:ABC-type phosphate/phosphonate transport system permease subunit
MQDVCDAYLFSQLPYDLPAILSYLMIFLSLFITVPSAFILLSMRRFHLIMRVANFIVTVILIVALVGDFEVEDSLALASNWTSFFTMPVLAY